jgi:hypothetical protein
MINRRIACVSIFISLSSLSGLVETASAAITAPSQFAIYGSSQQLTTYSNAQEESAPRQGLPGRRVSGGTRKSEVYGDYKFSSI